jgi:hypothetical protein
VLGVEPRSRRACSTKACSRACCRAAMAAGPVTSSTSRRASSGRSQPPTAVDSGNGRLHARRAGLAPGAGRRGLIRRRAQVKPVVQPFSDTATWATTKDASEGVRLATHDQSLAGPTRIRRSCRLTSPAGMCRWSTAQGEPLRIVVAGEFRIMCVGHRFAVVEQGAMLGQPSWWSSVMVTSMYSWSPSASFHAALPRTGRFSPSN